jgi:hypothetical protein
MTLSFVPAPLPPLRHLLGRLGIRRIEAVSERIPREEARGFNKYREV